MESRRRKLENGRQFPGNGRYLDLPGHRQIADVRRHRVRLVRAGGACRWSPSTSRERPAPMTYYI